MGKARLRFQTVTCVWILLSCSALAQVEFQLDEPQRSADLSANESTELIGESLESTLPSSPSPKFEAIVNEELTTPEPLPLSEQLPSQTSRDTPKLVVPPDFDDDDIEVAELAFFGDWLGYKSQLSDTTWVMGDGDRLGMFSIESFPVKKLGHGASLQGELSLHFLNGPVRTDLPPRLFDFVLGFHSRNWLTPNTMVSLKYSVGFFTDFEGSVRKGVRFPGHFVTYHREQDIAFVLGIEVLDRDDISLLPVVGAVHYGKDVIYEFVFPNPRIQWLGTDEGAYYLSGELGGGTWAIERDSLMNDNATIRDYRVAYGYISYGEAASTSFEIGYVFNRSLEYRSGIGNYDPNNAWMLRWRTHF